METEGAHEGARLEVPRSDARPVLLALHVADAVLEDVEDTPVRRVLHARTAAIPLRT